MNIILKVYPVNGPDYKIILTCEKNLTETEIETWMQNNTKNVKTWTRLN